MSNAHAVPSAVVTRRAHLEDLSNEIAELSAHIQAATHRLLTLIREFDEVGGWHEGFRSCAHWLAWRTGLELGAAREKVRVARALPELPQTAAALERGEVSYSKVRALSRVADAESEDHFLAVARHGTAAQLERVVRATRRAHLTVENNRAEQQQAARYLSWRSEEDSTLRLEARLPAEDGARLLRALESAVNALALEANETTEGGAGTEGNAQQAKGPREGIGARRADALLRLADGALAAGLPGCRAADKHRVVVHVDAAVLADPSAEGRCDLDGNGGGHAPVLSAETSRRLACDAQVVTIVEDASGTPLDVGRAKRTLPSALRRALDSRAPRCEFPGCEHERYLEAHHIEHWASGGATKLSNLAQLCAFHHRAVHEGGWQLAREPQGAVVATCEGHRLAAAPSSVVLDDEAVDRLLERQAEFAIDGGRLPVWQGDRLDLDWVLAGLHLPLSVSRAEVERARDGAEGGAGVTIVDAAA